MSRRTFCPPAGREAARATGGVREGKLTGRERWLADAEATRRAATVNFMVCEFGVGE
jgi:hypothetical protein